MVKILDSSYVQEELKQVAYTSSQLNDKERTMLLSLLKDFNGLFDSNLGAWATEPVNLELNPYYKRLIVEIFGP